MANIELSDEQQAKLFKLVMLTQSGRMSRSEFEKLGVMFNGTWVTEATLKHQVHKSDVFRNVAHREGEHKQIGVVVDVVFRVVI